MNGISRLDSVISEIELEQRYSLISSSCRVMRMTQQIYRGLRLPVEYIESTLRGYIKHIRSLMIIICSIHRMK